VYDVSASAVIKKQDGFTARNEALIVKCWAKVGLHMFRCIDGCTTTVQELLAKREFVQMYGEGMPAGDEKFFFDEKPSVLVQCKLQYLCVFRRDQGEPK
jgi:hypothetical protein